MNPLAADRQALIDALSAAGLTVDDTQPEIIEPDTVLLDSVTYTPGETFGKLAARYVLQVVLNAGTAQEAAYEQTETLNTIVEALIESSAGDFAQASALFNLQDAASNIYPAYTAEITSEIF